MGKKTYMYFYCVERTMGPGKTAKVNSVVATSEMINMNNYDKIRKAIEEDARRFVIEKEGAYPIGLAITALTPLNENVAEE